MPDEVTGGELDREVRAELSSLGADLSRAVARRLVMIATLIDEDPELAWEHAQVARRMAGRLGVVREAAGLAAYRAGHYADALAELRTARRITGSSEHLAVMADAERGLGRPERAIELASSPEAARLDPDAKVELLIVVAGARHDLGQLDTAIVTLQIPQLEQDRRSATTARLRVAYSDLLAAAGRAEESERWLHRAAEVDPDGSSGAVERLDENAGADVYDLEQEFEEDVDEDVEAGENDQAGENDESGDPQVANLPDDPTADATAGNLDRE